MACALQFDFYFVGYLAVEHARWICYRLAYDFDRPRLMDIWLPWRACLFIFQYFINSNWGRARGMAWMAGSPKGFHYSPVDDVGVNTRKHTHAYRETVEIRQLLGCFKFGSRNFQLVSEACQLVSFSFFGRFLPATRAYFHNYADDLSNSLIHIYFCTGI